MIGPKILFDKSFLQSLNIDESVWFNHFYICNVCPMFYIETLADLEKEIKNGRTAEEIIGNIAEKFPQTGMLNDYHDNMCLKNLLGIDIPINGQIMIQSGRVINNNNTTGLVIEETEEAKAFYRWQNKEFLTIERDYAKRLRDEVINLKLQDLYDLLNFFPLDYTLTKSIEEVKELVEGYLSDSNYFQKQAFLFCRLMKILPITLEKIFLVWKSRGRKSISEYAPYASYSLLIDIVFIISMKRGFISDQRNSNRIDIAYLKYLPFTQIFVSTDRLHEKLTKLFLNNRQEFIWGGDLKEDLTNLNNHYSKLPDEIKQKGIYYFAASPPSDKKFLTSRLHEKYTNFDFNSEINEFNEPRIDDEYINKIKPLLDAKSMGNDVLNFDSSNSDFMIIKHKMNKKKGSWYILPKTNGKKKGY